MRCKTPVKLRSELYSTSTTLLPPWNDSRMECRCTGRGELNFQSLLRYSCNGMIHHRNCQMTIASWESRWCSGYSPRLAPMGPGFNSRYGLYSVQMVSQSIFALAGFFPGSQVFLLLSKLVCVCYLHQKHPFTQGYWGAVFKKWMLQSKCW